MSKKTAFSRRDQCSAKLVQYLKNLSVPFERGHFFALEAQFTAFKRRRLRKYTTTPETLKFDVFQFSRHFRKLVARQQPRFGQNPPGKVLRVMSTYFQQYFSQF